MSSGALGRISSFQSLGTLDGPGLRFVVFMQGCPLRCVCCHNPETWSFEGGSEYTAEEVVARAVRYKEYFGKTGGITLSGGEPLMQAGFAKELFRLCRENFINTCLDTSGCVMNEEIEELLTFTDRVLLDIKYTDSESYLKYVGISMDAQMSFLNKLDKRKIPTVIRQVIIPHLNDTEDNILKLKSIAKSHQSVEKIELLPFKKLCSSKYDNMGLAFPLKDTPEPTREQIARLEKLLEN